jgi:hypothetical protein
MWLLVRSGQQLKAMHAAVVAVLCIASAFSNFSGIILCLFLPVVAFFLRSPYSLHLAVVLPLFYAA